MHFESTQPISTKDRHRVTACRECRRSKTKCTRKWPCEACVKRGCADICPEGVLVKPSYKSIESPEVAALRQQNERLIARIQLLERVVSLSSPSSVLEDSNLSSDATNASPPLESSQEDIIEAFGTLSIGSLGQSIYRNQVASSEFLLENGVEPLRSGIPLEGTVLPAGILYLAELFPHGRSTRPNPGLEYLILSFIPPADKTLKIVNCYYEHMAWMYDPIPRDQFMTGVFDRIFYGDHLRDISDVTFDHVALVFIMLALGMLLDLERPFNYKDSEPYYLLGLASFSLEANLTTPTLASIQTLQLTSTYTCLSERISAEERWLLMGTTIRMAQCAGLYRDISSWLKCDPEEVERRRKLFWELFVYDTWTSFLMGRPAVLANTKQIETRFPRECDAKTNSLDQPEPNFHSWKYRFTKECLIPVLDSVLSADPPTYQMILRLDACIRQHPIPPPLQVLPLDKMEQHSGQNVSFEMQKYFTLLFKETTLLYLHRSYFSHALTIGSGSPLRNKYAPSVLAAYRSASLLVGRLSRLIREQPIAARIWSFGSSLFSAAVVLGTLVVRSPRCTLSSNALNELNLACQLLERGSMTPRSIKASTILQQLRQKAQEAYNKHPTSAEANYAQSEVTVGGIQTVDDELAIFGGQTRLVFMTTPSNMEGDSSTQPGTTLQTPGDISYDAHTGLWNGISLTSFDALSELVPENFLPPQEMNDIVPDFTGLHFGMNFEMPNANAAPTNSSQKYLAG